MLSRPTLEQQVPTNKRKTEKGDGEERRKERVHPLELRMGGTCYRHKVDPRAMRRSLSSHDSSRDGSTWQSRFVVREYLTS